MSAKKKPERKCVKCGKVIAGGGHFEATGEHTARGPYCPACKPK